RATSLVVIGDRAQLAPEVGESLLDVALAAGLPTLQLATHYRSRHEDLFALANRRHYGDRLVVYPVASSSPELGVAYRRAEADEVEAIALEVLARLRDPGQRSRSIAIVTFDPAKRARVEQRLDGLVDELAEPLLVVDARHAQGQERDVVFVAIGADDLITLAQPGAERLTNVAFTRAREQLVIVSSLDQPDLVATSDAPGLQDLAAMLAFARAGGGAVRVGCADAAPATPITAAVARALADRGWSVRHQVGCGAYKLDLAVVAIGCAHNSSARRAGGCTGSGRWTGGGTPSARSSARTGRSSPRSRRPAVAPRRSASHADGRRATRSGSGRPARRRSSWPAPAALA
ncbi:MAG: AAA domain-containing protein, partial [Proteobacteria bacterium]|nr:AAA domain-containing protein [Pseudomonadota bacterium]